MSNLDRNKAIVRSFKECQGTKAQDATMREIMSPDYQRPRGGLVHLADGIGILLQLDALSMLEKPGCRPV